MVCLVLGMAGSGKTTLLQRISTKLFQEYGRPQPNLDNIDHSDSTEPSPPNNENNNAGDGDSAGDPFFLINLDPAVFKTGFEANIDIRDTVNFKQVMQHYRLGPNGAILTSLNLFATRFDQVVHIIQNKLTPKVAHQEQQSAKKKEEEKELGGDNGDNEETFWVFVDTPGQIETFSWSASGQVITEMLSSEWPTVIVFLLDSVRSSQNPVAFMSNLLYAVSIFYKFHLPFIIAFTKNDVGHNFDMLRGWMENFETFRTALRESRFGGNYSANLAESLALVLDEFYKNIPCVAVSAVTGEGMDELFEKIIAARHEYETEFRPALEKKIHTRREKERLRQEREMARVQADLEESHGGEVFLQAQTTTPASSLELSEPIPPPPQRQQKPTPSSESSSSSNNNRRRHRQVILLPKDESPQ